MHKKVVIVYLFRENERRMSTFCCGTHSRPATKTVLVFLFPALLEFIMNYENTQSHYECKKAVHAGQKCGLCNCS